MIIKKINMLILFLSVAIIMISSNLIADTSFKLKEKTKWNVLNSPLELSGICHISSNEYACVSDSGGRVFSFFIDENQLNSSNYVPTAKNFKLVREGVGYDLEGCAFVDGFLLCVDESNSSIKVLDSHKNEYFSFNLPIGKISSNCGVESLTYFSENQMFVTCTEQPTCGAPKNQIKLLFFTVDFVNKRCFVKYEIPYQIDEFDRNNIYRNGVSELLAWDKDTLLVVERAVNFDKKSPHCRIRIYAIDVSSGVEALEINGIDKHLVYEYDLDFFPANIEGIVRIPGEDKAIVLHDLPKMCVIGILEKDQNQ